MTLADRIVAIRKRLAAATPGPWEKQTYDADACGVPIIGNNLGGLVAVSSCWPTEIDTDGSDRVTANADLIAKAPSDLAFLLEQVERMQWRDMASAPRDGTHILVCFGEHPYSETWTFDQSPPTVAHWFGPADLPGLRAGGWYLSVCQNDSEKIHPTRWMPLPSPPEERE